jgi:hypothetical protein
MLAQQLVAAGERVLDVQPKLAARVRLLATEAVNNNDPHDARSVAIAALRSATPKQVRAEDHAAVMKLWAKRQRDLSRARNKVACRLHAVLCELIPGGVRGEIYAAQAAKLLEGIEPDGAVAAARHELASDLLDDLRRVDAQLRDSKKRLTAVVAASKTTTTEVFGVAPIHRLFSPATPGPTLTLRRPAGAHDETPGGQPRRRAEKPLDEQRGLDLSRGRGGLRSDDGRPDGLIGCAAPVPVVRWRRQGPGGHRSRAWPMAMAASPAPDHRQAGLEGAPSVDHL